MQPNKTRADLWMDLLLVAFLVAFNVAARLLPHAPGFLPVAASGLFAARYLRHSGTCGHRTVAWHGAERHGAAE